MSLLRLAALVIVTAVGVTALLLAVMTLRQFGAGLWGVAFLLCMIAAAAWAGVARLWPRGTEHRPPATADRPAAPESAGPIIEDESRPPR